MVFIIAGSVVAWLRYSPQRPLEISLPDTPETQGEIYISGAVNSPGYYPIREGATVDELIRMAGGTTGSADLDGLELYIPGIDEEQYTQKININKAEAWLLMALPGIGETLARRIVDYRQDNGPYRTTIELQKVSGIGTDKYERIKHLITVAD